MNPRTAQLEQTLALTEQRIAEILADSNRLVRECVETVSRSRGKRLRPRLMAVHAMLAGSPDLRQVANCAACCELLHTASLIHDDVIDEASTRRGADTLNQLFGNEIAVVVGDYILASLLRSLAGERDFQLIDMLISTSQELGLGVIEEVQNRDNLHLSEERYFEVIYLKTAALFSLCCGMGAYLGGADDKLRQQSLAYGKQLGLAFQVVDDLLDLLADPAQTGKSALSDIREGRVTLPMIHAWNIEPEETKRVYQHVKDISGDGAPRLVREHLGRLGSLTHAYNSACDLLAQARLIGEELRLSAVHPDMDQELMAIEQQVISVLPLVEALGTR